MQTIGAFKLHRLSKCFAIKKGCTTNLTKILSITAIIIVEASMCLVHSARDMTKDVDALYEPKAIINEISEKIARENDLPLDWLNDGVKGFVNKKIETEKFSQFGTLKVTTVTPEYLPAMKLRSAGFTGQDYSDIKYLLNKLNVQTVSEAQNIVEKFYPIELILPKTMYIIEQSLEEM